MKKIIIALVLSVLVFAPVRAYTDTVVNKVADGAIGTSGVAYRVKGLVFNCSTQVDSIAASAVTANRPCYGTLHNGTGVVASGSAPLLHFQANITNPTVTLDLTWINKGTSKAGMLFGSGLYYDEVTGSTSITVIYDDR